MPTDEVGIWDSEVAQWLEYFAHNRKTLGHPIVRMSSLTPRPIVPEQTLCLGGLVNWIAQ